MPESRSYRPDIDGLRAIAVLAIVVHHVFPSVLTGGYVGVDVFFVISGFLITGIVVDEMRMGGFSFAAFYLRRARRLLPPLYAMLACVLLAGWAMLLPSDYAATMRAAMGSVLFASNLVFECILADGYFAADAKLNPLLHTWSLGVEEQFYLLYPALLAISWRLGRNRGIAWTLLPSLALSFCAAAYMVQSEPVQAFFLAPFRAWELFVGAALAYFRVGGGIGALQARILRVAGLAAILASCIWYDETTVFPGPSALLPVLGAAMVVAAGTAGQELSGLGILAMRPMVYLGRISYSFYLWHWPLLVFARFRSPEPLPVSVSLCLIFVSALLAAASYHLVERPLRGPRPIRWRAPAALAMSIGLLALCGFGLSMRGYAQRFDAATVALDDARKEAFEFKACRPSHPCVVGDRSLTPDILLWGDSHMLAWAPGFDRLLRQRGRAAILAYTPACPPMLEVQVSRTPDCLVSNREVVAMLSRAPGLHTVALASRWGLNGDHPEWFRRDGQATTVEASLLALVRTLKAEGRDVAVLGPIPVYATDVPLQLAREQAYGWRQATVTLVDHRRANATFYAAVPALEQAGARFVDPARGMCASVCVRIDEGRSLYRDKQHLSAFGARELGPRLLDASLR